MPSPYIDKRVLVILNYLDPAGQVKKKVEVYGVITRISDEDGIFIEQANGKGEFKLALSPDLLRKVAADSYTLASTGETVVDPDYVIKRSISAHLPSEKTSLMGTLSGGKRQDEYFQLPKICAHCGTRNEPRQLWELISTHTGPVGSSVTASLAVFAGIHISRVTIYRFKVPLCQTCTEKLTLIAKLKWVIIGAGPLLAAVSLWIGNLLRRQQLEAAGDLASILMLTFIVIGAVIYLRYRNFGHQFGWFNFRNGTFYFRNADFQKAFATLNPSLVKSPAK
jgi:hypothetical protein